MNNERSNGNNKHNNARAAGSKEATRLEDRHTPRK
ncbi:hypothetical protein C163_11440 [Pseudomonas sp. FGI182]|nr:hypothetical protein C163_11440 [Pseudomonas sp. FGI182]